MRGRYKFDESVLGMKGFNLDENVMYYGRRGHVQDWDDDSVEFEIEKRDLSSTTTSFELDILVKGWKHMNTDNTSCVG